MKTTTKFATFATIAALAAAMPGWGSVTDNLAALEKPVYIFYGASSADATRTMEGSYYCSKWDNGYSQFTSVNFDTEFDGTTARTGTIVKKDNGSYPGAVGFNTDHLKCFTGTIIVEDGIWKVTGAGHIGGNGCTVVVTNEASVVFDIANTESPDFQQAFKLRGDGVGGNGALQIESIGNSAWYQFFHNARLEVSGGNTNATIGIRHVNNRTIGTYGSTFALNTNNELVFKALVDNTVASSDHTYLVPYDLKVQGSGAIVLRGLDWRYYGNAPVAEDGSTDLGAVILRFRSLELPPAGSNVYLDNWLECSYGGYQCMMPFRLRIAENFIHHSDSGGTVSWGTTNLVGWGGAVELMGNPGDYDDQTVIDSTSGGSFTFLNKVDGNGGLKVESGMQISLVDGRNEFCGPVTINAGAAADPARSSSASRGELRVFWPGALPAVGRGEYVTGAYTDVTGQGAVLYDSDLTLMYGDMYELPALTFDIAAGKTNVFSGATNGFVRSLAVRGGGTLDMTAPLTVTGITEIASGSTLRIPCDRAGIAYGWKAWSDDSSVESTAHDIRALSVSCTNNFTLGADIAYTHDLVWWHRLEDEGANRRIFYYDGYVWNNSGESQTWTFAMQFGRGTLLWIDGNRVDWYHGPNTASATKFPDDDYDKPFEYHKVAFAKYDLSPGAHKIDLRAYALTNKLDYGTIKNSQGELTNVGVWDADFGFGVDKTGGTSVDSADYEPLIDPGDGSFLTLVADRSEAFAQNLRRFELDNLRFGEGGGALDTRGGKVTVGVFEIGASGTVTNSNTYFTDGVVTICGKFKATADNVNGGRKLSVTGGKLKFESGSTIEIENATDLSRVEHVIAEADGGIEGLPRFNDANHYMKIGWIPVVEGTKLKVKWSPGLKTIFK